MADLRIKGDVSGYVDLVAPDAAGSTTIDLSKVITSTGSATTLDANNVVTSNTATTFTEDVIFAGGDNCVDLRIGTDKRIAFSGNIGEIGNVPGFQAMNTAGSANVALGMRGTDIRFATGSAERMRIEDTGIDVSGSITADTQVKVLGSNASNVAFSVGDTGTGWYNAGSNAIALSNNGTPSIHVKNGGNVGIGTTNPGQKLTVAGAVESTSAQGSTAFYSTTAGSYNQQNGSGGTAWAYGSTGGQSAPNTAASTTFGLHHWNGSAWSNPLNVATDGNIGIGVPYGYGKLSIGGGTGGGNIPANTSILFGSDDNRNIQFLGQSANGNEGTIGAWNGVYNFQSSKIVFNKPAGNVGEMLFYTNQGAGPVLRVAMTHHGRVVFSPSGVADGQGVTTYANGANGHYVSCTGTSNYWITNHGVASATGTLSTFYNNGTYCGGISISSTNVTSYVSASDYRLKENVVPMTGATERLKQLNPVTFDWINSGESSEGFIAHEVGAIVPISTTGTKDEVYDEEGAADNPKINEGDPKYQSVDPAKLVPLLVKTIQELEARITALESGN